MDLQSPRRRQRVSSITLIEPQINASQIDSERLDEKIEHIEETVQQKEIQEPSRSRLSSRAFAAGTAIMNTFRSCYSPVRSSESMKHERNRLSLEVDADLPAVLKLFEPECIGEASTLVPTIPSPEPEQMTHPAYELPNPRFSNPIGMQAYSAPKVNEDGPIHQCVPSNLSGDKRWTFTPS